MFNIKKTIKNIFRRWKNATSLVPLFPKGTKLSFLYRLRRFLAPNIYIPASIVSPSGAIHYLSNDPIDERVVEEIIGSLSDLFFPVFSSIIESELTKGASIVDIGAFNGTWGIEILKRFPNSNAIFLEPNPQKCRNIVKSCEKSRLMNRSKFVSAGIAKYKGNAWLLKSKDGSWGDWLEYNMPNDNNGAIKVKTVTLKDALNGTEPIMVKCNAEGGEFEFVKQLLETDIRPKIMILMIHPEMGNIDNLEVSLLRSGYSINKIRDHKRRPVWHLELQ